MFRCLPSSIFIVCSNLHFYPLTSSSSGFITIEDFRQTWKLLSVYLKMEITDEAISDLAVTIDSNKDGSIDIDEFMEAFRLTDKKSRLERGRSMFMVTTSDQPKVEGDRRSQPLRQEEEGGLKTENDLSSVSSAAEQLTGDQGGVVNAGCINDAL